MLQQVLENMGMKMGKYSMDGDRYNSRTGANAGYDLEFTLFDWKRWIFTSTKKGGFKKKPRTEKKIKRGKTKGKSKGRTKGKSKGRKGKRRTLEKKLEVVRK